MSTDHSTASKMKNSGSGPKYDTSPIPVDLRYDSARRASELADAVASFSGEGTTPDLAAAAVGVLRQAALAWDDGAPPEGTPPGDLARHLRKARWTKHTSR